MEFTVDNVKKVVDRGIRPYITDDFISLVNGATEDSDIADEIKSNILSYSSVLMSGKFKLSDYINAVKFVSYKLLGKNNTQAYILTFPERYDKLVREEVQDISPYASMYSKNKLVTEIMTQTIIPSYVLNQFMFQDALNIAYDIMTDTRQKGLIRVKACETILNFTKQPEKTQISLDVTNGNSEVADMRAALTEMAKIHKDMLVNSNASLKAIIESPIIDIAEED